MRVAACPSPAALERLFLGGLPAADTDAIERHVLECSECSTRLEELFGSKDPLSGILRAKASDPTDSVPIIDELIKKVESLRPCNSPIPQGNVMIAISCTSCQKKLSVKENAAGKKVKCPACGSLVAVPAPVAVGVEEMRTVPPTADREQPTNAPSELNPDAAPTHPPSERPDQTIAVKPEPAHETSLTDFLSPPQASDELGRLGKYRILKILGHGGMGVVYKAEDPLLQRTVAIKAMLPTLAASASAGQRFLREARAMAKVEHDHIVRIYQVDDERGIPFMAMEFLKGEPLDERLKRDEQLPVAEILRIGREIAEGLGAAHAIGLIHRDIKPGNIWLEDRNQGSGVRGQGSLGRVKILDFGLARAATQEAGLTQQGAIIGTPAYMSPEQARGENVDARTDLFSLGVALYRMCTGQQPFQGRDTVSTLMAVAMNDPVPPSKINNAIPPELSELVMKLLEKDLAKRIGSAAEVVQTIQAIEKKLAWQEMEKGKTEAIQAGEPQLKQSPRLSPQATKAPAGLSRRRRPMALVALAAVFAFLCVLGGGIFYWQTNNGIVIVEINDPEIQVSFDKKELVFKDGKEDFRIGTGEYGMRVKKGDLEFDTDKPIVVKRGDTIRLKVSYQVSGKNDLGQFMKKLAIEESGKELGKKEVTVNPPPKTNDVPPAGPFALSFSKADDAAVRVPSLRLSEDIPLTFECYTTPAPPSGNAELIEFPFQVSLMIRGAKGGWAWAFSPNPVGIDAPLEKGRRIHLAAVRSGDTLRLFIDGKKVADKSFPDLKLKTTKQPNMSFWLGHRYEGTIEQVRISKIARYDRDFQPPEIFKKDDDTWALYRFDEGSGNVLKDSSGNGHNGTISGAKWVMADGTPITAPPAEKYVLRFTGDNNVTVPGIKLDPKGPTTMEAFFRCDSATETTGINSTIIAFDHFNIYLHDGRYLRAGCTLTDKQWQLVAKKADDFLKPGQRHHVAAVRTKDKFIVYIDGREFGRKPLADFDLIPAEKPFRIGGNFNGEISEVRISSSVRYTGKFNPPARFTPDADTLALFHMDEGSGDKLIDSSANEHHGTINGAKWVKVAAPPPSVPAGQPRLLSSVTPAGGVRSMVLTADGTLITGGDGGIKFFDPVKGVLLHDMPKEGKIACLALSRDSKTLYYAGRSKTNKFFDDVNVLDVGTKEARQLFWNQHISSLAVSADESILAYSADAMVKTVGVKTARHQTSTKLASTSQAMKFSADGNRLLVVDSEKLLTLDPQKQLQKTGEMGLGAFNWFDVSKDGLIAVSSGGFYLGAIGQPKTTPYPSQPSAGVFSPDGETLATGCVDGNIYLWNVRNIRQGKKELLAKWPAFEPRKDNGPLPIFPTGMAFSPDGKMLAAFGRDGIIKVWDLTPGKDATAPTPPGTTPTIDLLSLINPAKDAVVGAWKFNDKGEIVSDMALGARIRIPYQPPAEYDLHVSLTRLSGQQCVFQFLVGGGRQFALGLGAHDNTQSFFEMVDGKAGEANPTKKPRGLTALKRYESRIEVRRNGVKAFLDGVLVTELLQTDFKNVEINPVMDLKTPGVLGLGSWSSATAFHKVQVVEISGPGTFTRPSDPAAVRAAASRLAPPPLANAPGPWQSMMDGTLSHFYRGKGNKPEAVAITSLDGEPVVRIAGAGRPVIFSKKQVQNMHLRLQFQTPFKGTMQLAAGQHRQDGKTGISFQIDQAGKSVVYAWGMKANYAAAEKGGIVSTGKAIPVSQNVSLADATLEPPGQWNRLELVRADDRFAFFINGRFLGAVADIRGVVDGNDFELGKGPIRIGGEGDKGESLIRRIEVRDITALPPELLAPVPWQPLLDANDLTRFWDTHGAVKTGAVSLLDQKGEPVLRMQRDVDEVYVSTKQVFRNYHYRLEFQFPEDKKPAGFTVGFTTGINGKTGLTFGVASDAKSWPNPWGLHLTQAFIDQGIIVAKGPGKIKFLDARLGPAGAWNRLDLVRIDDKFAGFINGQFVGAVADVRVLGDGRESPIGAIGIRMHAQPGVVLFRKLEIRDITALPPELLAPGPWQPLLDRNLSHWWKIFNDKGPDAFGVIALDGEPVVGLSMRPTKPILSSKKFYKNAHLRLEFQLPNKGAEFAPAYGFGNGKAGVEFHIAQDGQTRAYVYGGRLREAKLQGGGLVATGPVKQGGDLWFARADLEPPGKWNRLDLVRVEDGFAYFLNGRFVGALAETAWDESGNGAPFGASTFNIAPVRGDGMLIRRIEVRDITALPPELFEPGPWQPLLDAKLSHFWQLNENKPGAIVGTDIDGEPALRGAGEKRQAIFTKWSLGEKKHLSAQFQTPSKGPTEFDFAFGLGGPARIEFHVADNGKSRAFLGSVKANIGAIERGGIVSTAKVCPSGQFFSLLDASLAPPGKWNQIDLVRLDDRIAFFVNGRFLGAVTDLRRNPDGARLGLGTIEVGFDKGESLIRRIQVRDITALPAELLASPPKASVFPPLDPLWLKAVAAMKPEQQVEAVKAELKKRNPGFDGKLDRKLDKDGAVMELSFVTDNVTDVSPVRAIAGLQSLICGGTPYQRKGQLADLSPLRGMKLTRLACYDTKVSDLSPLKDMKLTYLNFGSTEVSDLSALKDMKLTELACDWAKVTDLSPLKDMKLTYLECRGTPLTDLSPLSAMPLKEIKLDFQADRHGPVLRAIKTLEKINDKDAKEFLKSANTSALPPLDPNWLKAVAAMKPDEQLEAVKAELMKRNPGFDGVLKGKTPGGVVTELEFSTDQVRDISPVRALTGLRRLACNATHAMGGPQGSLADLSPLAGLQLDQLSCVNNKQLTDLKPLAGMKLTALRCWHTSVADLSPLKDMKLKELSAGHTNIADLAPLKGMPLTRLDFSTDRVGDISVVGTLKDLRELSCSGSHTGDGPQGRLADLAPLAGLQLEKLSCFNNKQLIELTPLKGMPLKELVCYHTSVADLAPLKGMKLSEINCGFTKVAELAPLKGMPLIQLNCDKTLVADLSPLAATPLREINCDIRTDADRKVLRSIKTLEKINGKDAKEVLK